MTLAAFEVFGAIQSDCLATFSRNLTKDGEDLYAELCLRHAHIPAVDAPGLLNGFARTKHAWNLQQIVSACAPGHMTSVSYHPFKTPKSWLACYGARHGPRTEQIWGV
eukprot:gnl/TRDRNA2_/TRDRNA2_87861_c0_seq1.p1 gnl/TRDRNA2_/TRDRNA2_87861_c0~~gnl/TRDRNA2_/TRDRNA2_87861_c0_seq1.p1  ORF type:complete len:116 (+),score=10.35 gnl/TRDRNA2_/TRDRNA2_87861_c0_seq1:26-349(+)